ncbi:MAG: TIGR03663 family protein [Chloroflexota bacterium]|jgi:predicted membrane-bound mannosyltransferase/DNA-binding beta-propeller fold protein YncE
MTELINDNQPESPSSALDQPILARINFDLEKAIFLAFFILALITRLWGVGDRVVSHDESLHTQYSYQYYNGDGYAHSPLMHGPTLFHFTALSFWLFGDSDASARIPVAIIGSILVILPYFLKQWTGSLGAIVASFLLLISPYITYYSRYIRHDIPIITAAVIVFIAILHYLRERKDKYLWWFAVGLALMFTTMETSYIYVAIFGSFLVVALVVRIAASPWLRERWPAVRLPLLVVVLAGILFAAGFGLQHYAPRALAEATPQAGTATEEGFAADPNETLETGPQVEQEAASVTAGRWLQLGGLFLLAGSLFWTATRMRPFIDQYPEFDLVLLFTTLVLPAATAFLVVIAGEDPLAHTVNVCQLAGQETMSAFTLLINRLSNATCREAFLSSPIALTGAFLILTLVISILVGLWWNRRRWLIAAAIYHGIFLVFYTSFFTNPPGWASGMVGSLGYWLAQQEVQRANQPMGFYFLVLPLYEFLPLLLTLGAAYLYAKKHSLNKLLAYLVTLILITLLVFSFSNWYFRQGVENPEAMGNTPGLLLGGLVLLAGLAFAVWYWLIEKRGRPLDVAGEPWSWRDVLTLETFLGFVPYLLWWFVLSWIIYTYAGEKMAWLSSHFVFPMVLLAGWFVNEVVASANKVELKSRRFALLVGLTALFLLAAALFFAPIFLGRIDLGGQQAGNLSGLGRVLGLLLLAGALLYFVLRVGRSMAAGTRRRAWLFAALILLALLTIRFTYMASFPNADYVTEFMVYAHGAPATKSQVLPQLEELSVRLEGDKSIQVAYDNDSSWPFTWYLRDYPNRLYFGENPGRNIAEAPVVIVGSFNWDKVEPLLGDDYASNTYTFLWWPTEAYRNISWAAVLGDPKVEPEFRRGIFNPDVRQALWDIFFYRDYQRYGEVFGGDFSPGQWQPRHDLRMYIRKDVLANIWDYGVAAIASEPPVDPYAEGDRQLQPEQVIGQPGTEPGQFMLPRNVAVGPDGLLYIADSGNHRIQVFDADGRYVRSWGEFGTGPGQFNEPWSLAVDDHQVVVADTWNHRLQKFTLDGQWLATIGESGSPETFDSGGGLFFGPRDVLILPDGNLLVTDTGNHRLQLFDAEGKFIRAVGGNGALPGQFFEPVGLALGSDGSIFVADTWNGRIQRLDASLQPVSEWPVDAWAGDSINNKPYLAVSDDGTVYVTDPEGYRVLIFDVNGNYLGRFGQYSPDTDGFGLPNGLALDAQGDLYVADANNNRLLRFDVTGSG